MAPPESSLWTWLRQHFLWSNTRQAWEERLGVLILLGGPVALFFLTQDRPLSQQVPLWGGLVLLVAALLRRGWLHLFGPVLFYDLIRVSRRTRYFLVRFLYIAGLGTILCWFFFITSINPNYEHGIPPREMANFAEGYFYTFMWIQFVVVVILTPAYTAAAIADEKDRKTLEFILATDLRNREIILSKWTSRLANLTLLLLGGLPILSLIQFLGGVDPDLVIAGFVATALTMVSLAAVSILTSVYARRARDAIVLTYLTVIGYYAISGLAQILVLVSTRFASAGVQLDWFSLTMAEVVDWFNAGNLFTALFKLAMAGGPRPRGGITILTDSLPELLRNYAIFHALVTVGCVGLAVLRLRIVALRQTEVKTTRRGRKLRGRRRPRLGTHPMVWKELWVEGGLRLNILGRIVVLLLFCASVTPIFLIAYFVFEDRFQRGRFATWSDAWDEFGQAMNIYVRIVGMLVGCLLLLGVAVRAAGSISGERDKQTMESLLTTPLDSNAMLLAKWLGSLLSVRWGLVWLGFIWLCGLVSGGLHPVALPLLVVAWLVYAAVIALLGLWFSMVSKTTLRAMMWTVVCTIGFAVGHYLLTACCGSLFMFTREAPEFLNYLFQFQNGASPPVVLFWMLPFCTNDLERNYWMGDPVEKVGYAVFGLLCWGTLAVLLWQAASKRFRMLTGRQAFVPKRPAPPRRPGPRPVSESGAAGEPQALS